MFFSSPSGISDSPDDRTSSTSARSTVSVWLFSRFSVIPAADSDAISPVSTFPSFVRTVYET